MVRPVASWVRILDPAGEQDESAFRSIARKANGRSNETSMTRCAGAGSDRTHAHHRERAAGLEAARGEPGSRSLFGLD